MSPNMFMLYFLTLLWFYFMKMDKFVQFELMGTFHCSFPPIFWEKIHKFSICLFFERGDWSSRRNKNTQKTKIGPFGMHLPIFIEKGELYLTNISQYITSLKGCSKSPHRSKSPHFTVQFDISYEDVKIVSGWTESKVMYRKGTFDMEGI